MVLTVQPGPSDVLCTMSAEDKAAVQSLLATSFDEMFAQVQRPPGADPGDKLLAVSIGFSGTGLRGALVIAAKPGFFVATYPLPPPDALPSADDVDDWARECGNQLLGRVKNRLGARGVQMSVSTPTALRGFELKISRRDREGAVLYSAKSQGLDVTVLFELERLDGQGLLAPNAPETDVSAEGESMLF
jgi:hypothetical protein